MGTGSEASSRRPADTAVIKGLSGLEIVFIVTPAADSVMNLTTDNTVHLQVESGSLTLSVGSPTTFGGPVDRGDAGAARTSAQRAQVTIN